MATVINNPPQSNDSGGSMGMIVGVIVLVVLAYLFFVYGLPAVQQNQSGGTQINVPDKIEVDINKSE